MIKKHINFMRNISLSPTPIEDVNLFWNVNIAYKPDIKSDYWQTPNETLERGSGDCEDIAIGKFFDLLAISKKPRLVYAIIPIGGEAHLLCECEGIMLDCQDNDYAEVFRFGMDHAYVGKTAIKNHPFRMFPQFEKICMK